MIYFIYGEDSFRVREYMTAIKEAGEKANVAIVNLNASEVTTETLAEHISSRSLFSTKRVVFIRNLLSHGSTELKESVLSSLPRLPSEVTIVFWEEGVPDRRTRLFSQLSKVARRIEKPLLKDKEVIQWIGERTQKKKAKISRDAAELLAQAIGSDLGRADLELEKLTLYAKGHEIRTEDVSSLVESSLPGSIFDLLDALGDQGGRSGLLIERLLMSGEEPLYILSMLSYQVRNLILVKHLVTERPYLRNYDVARELGLHPYVAQKTIGQAKQFSREHLINLHRRITDADIAIKTGIVEAPEALILLVAGKPAGASSTF